ncbi:mitochondrial ribosomal protein S5 (uS5m) [Andalucia godoyi]|uniref:Mitochondrial ribosomal protein S5 (US5m) n=1 Tax=Andalucia godoyi TaxID=505711 RepID=A0A8K0AJD8_ANDGO|nr:mitochondrial ribosomal protein S5 (uS5m) [Andalucia godoyi]|eukprot:ANDGO_05657.mRNA.1 mitochondrial ribosomal protein S5 (uS5m)
MLLLRRMFSSAFPRAGGRAPEEVRVLDVRRVTKVTKGGKVLGFTALVVSGNLSGCVGYGYGKALDVPSAVQKALEQSRRTRIFLEQPADVSQATARQTITHAVKAEHCETIVELRPARVNSGIRANRNITAIAQVAGIQDISAKVHGSTNKLNVIKAAFDALKLLETPQDVALRRGVAVFHSDSSSS